MVTTPTLEIQKQRLNNLVEMIDEQEAKLNRLKEKRRLAKERTTNNLKLGNELKACTDALSIKRQELREASNRVDKLKYFSTNGCKRARANRNSGINSNNTSRGSIIDTEPTFRKSKIATGRRVSFDPLALLLDAALEGELDLVIQTSKQVADLNASHDECVTALHNAAVAGHYEVARYLIEAGCDINVQDSDENGALIYATTYSDSSTPAMKCEPNVADYQDCYDYLMYIQNNLGVINDGIVYALYDYKAQKEDELSFETNEELKILRRDDSQEEEWWWAQIGSNQPTNEPNEELEEGYIPRNLIGLYKRVKPPKGSNYSHSKSNANDINGN